jgi:hypothetical protein
MPAFEKEKVKKVNSNCKNKIKTLKITPTSKNISNKRIQKVKVKGLTQEKIDALFVESTLWNKKSFSNFIIPKMIKTKRLELIYRASRDGYKSSDFHSKCNGKKNTITFIKS